MNNTAIFILITLILFCFYACQNREKLVDKSKLIGSDYRLFQETPAWEVAKAISDENINRINEILRNDSSLVNFQDSVYGNTLLMMAIQNQQYNSFEALLKNNANINLYNSYSGSSAIIEACKFRDYDIKFLKKLLEYGANVNDIEIGERRKGNSTRYTPLISASRGGNLEMIKLLLKNGANINFQNEYGRTALSQALLTGKYEVVLLLLENGADYKKPIFFREHENRDIFIRDLLQEDTKWNRQDSKYKVISFLDANE